MVRREGLRARDPGAPRRTSIRREIRSHSLAAILNKLIRRVTTIVDRKLESGVLSLLLAPLGHLETAGDPGGTSIPPTAP